MGNAFIDFKELRFVIEGEQTHAYVYLEVSGDAPHTLQGWHHKAYPASMPVGEILNRMFTKKPDDSGGDDPVLWPQKPPDEKKYFTPDPDAPMKMLERMMKEGPEKVLRDVLGPDATIESGDGYIKFSAPLKDQQG